jgi:glycosyltransferase involved in cell wall biosynthesis
MILPILRPDGCHRRITTAPAVTEDGMKLLALVDSPDHVCCRYRIRAFAAAIAQAGWSLTCEGLDRGAFVRSFQLHRAADFDAVILQRKLLPSWQLRALRRAARHLVFDFDDAVLYRDSYRSRGPHSRWRYRRFAQTVCTVDTIVAGNDFLADCALRAGASVERVHVIPTCVEPRTYPVARHDVAKSAVDLVWIGSSSTLQGLEQIGPIWQRLATALPQLRLRVICDRFPESFPLPVIAVPWKENTEARELASADIGVSWLPDDLWSRGKCGLKVLQYHAAGLPVVANPVGLHREMIKDGETGFLATDPSEWVLAIARLVADARLRQRIGSSARQQVESSYSVSAWAETFVSSMTGVSPAAVSSSWKIDRRPLPGERVVSGPHVARSRPMPTFKQIGD